MSGSRPVIMEVTARIRSNVACTVECPSSSTTTTVALPSFATDRLPSSRPIDQRWDRSRGIIFASRRPTGCDHTWNSANGIVFTNVPTPTSSTVRTYASRDAARTGQSPAARVGSQSLGLGGFAPSPEAYNKVCAEVELLKGRLQQAEECHRAELAAQKPENQLAEQRQSFAKERADLEATQRQEVQALHGRIEEQFTQLQKLRAELKEIQSARAKAEDLNAEFQEKIRSLTTSDAENRGEVQKLRAEKESNEYTISQLEEAQRTNRDELKRIQADFQQFRDESTPQWDSNQPLIARAKEEASVVVRRELEPQIHTLRTELEKERDDLSAARQNIETLSSELEQSRRTIKDLKVSIESEKEAHSKTLTSLQARHRLADENAKAEIEELKTSIRSLKTSLVPRRERQQQRQTYDAYHSLWDIGFREPSSIGQMHMAQACRAINDSLLYWRQVQAQFFSSSALLAARRKHPQLLKEIQVFIEGKISGERSALHRSLEVRKEVDISVVRTFQAAHMSRALTRNFFYRHETETELIDMSLYADLGFALDDLADNTEGLDRRAVKHSRQLLWEVRNLMKLHLLQASPGATKAIHVLGKDVEPHIQRLRRDIGDGRAAERSPELTAVFEDYKLTLRDQQALHDAIARRVMIEASLDKAKFATSEMEFDAAIHKEKSEIERRIKDRLKSFTGSGFRSLDMRAVAAKVPRIPVRAARSTINSRKVAKPIVTKTRSLLSESAAAKLLAKMSGWETLISYEKTNIEKVERRRRLAAEADPVDSEALKRCDVKIKIAKRQIIRAKQHLLHAEATLKQSGRSSTLLSSSPGGLKPTAKLQASRAFQPSIPTDDLIRACYRHGHHSEKDVDLPISTINQLPVHDRSRQDLNVERATISGEMGLDVTPTQPSAITSTQATSSLKEQYWSHKQYKDCNGRAPSVYYCTSYETAERQARLFLDEPVLGFDLEWESFASLKTHGARQTASLVQLACKDKIGLFHLACFKGTADDNLMPPSLRTILLSPSITKTGVNVVGDVNRIRQVFGIDMKGTFELSHLYRVVKYSQDSPSLVNFTLVSLATQVSDILGLPLKKDETRVSRWSSKLNAQQIDYAAADAYAGYQLYIELERRRMLMDPLPPRPEFFETLAPLVLGDGTKVMRRIRKSRKTEAEGVAEDADENEEFFDAVESIEEDPTMPLSQSAPGSITDEIVYPVLPLPNDSSMSEKMSIPEEAELKQNALQKLQSVVQSRGPAATLPTHPETRAADDWARTFLLSVARGIGSHTSQPRRVAHASTLRAYHLWHKQNFDLRQVAAFCRDPPLALTTVASYVMTACNEENLPFSKTRAADVLDALPLVVKGKYERMIDLRGE